MSNDLAGTQRSAATKVLHWAAALVVIAQLGLSLVMQNPDGNRPGDAFFEIHEKLGIAAVVVLVTFWLWCVVRAGETRLIAFFPWFSPKQIGLVVADARRLFAPLGEGVGERPFASAVHGVGLMIATIMAMTGVLGYFVVSARPLLGIHETVAPLMWAYLAGHVAISVVHELRGDHIIKAMLTFTPRQ